MTGVSQTKIIDHLKGERENLDFLAALVTSDDQSPSFERESAR
jgi:hypothetical protein